MSENVQKNDQDDIVIDMSYLSDIASGSVEFMVDMITIFIDQTPDYIKQLEASILEKNWKDVADIAHKIKPTLAFMGVASARDDMEVIESNARALSNLEEIEIKFDTLKVLCHKLIIKLEQLREELQQKL